MHYASTKLDKKPPANKNDDALLPCRYFNVFHKQKRSNKSKSFDKPSRNINFPTYFTELHHDVRHKLKQIMFHVAYLVPTMFSIVAATHKLIQWKRGGDLYEKKKNRINQAFLLLLKLKLVEILTHFKILLWSDIVSVSIPKQFQLHLTPFSNALLIILLLNNDSWRAPKIRMLG